MNKRRIFFPGFCMMIAVVGFSAVQAGWDWINPTVTNNPLNAVWGSSADNVYAVGDFGSVIHWNGTKWTRMPVPGNRMLVGVWGSSPDDVWVIGSGDFHRYEDVVYGSLMIHWDGQKWSNVDGTNLSDYCIFRDI